MAIVEGYATLLEVKADLRLTTTTDDARIERAIEAASRQIDNTTHRKFYAELGAVRMFSSHGPYVWIDELTTLTTVEQSSDQATWTMVTSGWVTNPTPPIRKLQLTSGEWAAFVRITGDWGPAAIPAVVNQACRIQAVRLFKRPDTPEGVLVGDFGAARLGRVDPDVLGLIRPLARKVVG